MAWTERYLDMSAGSNGDGTSATPWNTIANAIAGLTTLYGGTTATVQTMVRVKGSQTLAAAQAFNLIGTTAFPIWWRGCDSSFVGIADGDTTTTRPSVVCGANQVTLVGNRAIYTHLSFVGSQTGSSFGQVRADGLGCLYYRCRFEATATSRAMYIGNDESRVVGCWIKSPNAATNALFMGGSRGGAFGCTVRGGQTTISGFPVVGCAVLCGGSGTLDGISAEGTGAVVIGNSVYAPGRDGIRIGSTGIAMNNVVSGAGAYGFNYNATASIAPLFISNGYYNCTSGGFGPGNLEGFRVADPGTNGLLAGDPFVNAAAGDLSLTTHAKALGFPGGFENETLVSYLDLGAVQRVEPSGGGGSAVFNPLGNFIIRGVS